MNRILAVFFGVFSILCVPGLATTIQNRCNEPLNIFFIGTASGGSDGLGDEGSWEKYTTWGVEQVGPFQNMELPAGARGVLITTRRTRVTRSELGNPKVLWGCIRRDRQSRFEIKTWGTAAEPVKSCIKQNGHWEAFEVVSHFSNYTIPQESCNQPARTPQELREHWQSDLWHIVPMRTTANNEKEWHFYPGSDQADGSEQTLFEIARDAQGIIFRKPQSSGTVYFKITATHLYASRNPNGDWEMQTTGGWSN